MSCLTFHEMILRVQYPASRVPCALADC